jgi:hypothetical protein
MPTSTSTSIDLTSDLWRFTSTPDVNIFDHANGVGRKINFPLPGFGTLSSPWLCDNAEP